MALIRSVIHLLWMGITVVPYALAIMHPNTRRYFDQYKIPYEIIAQDTRRLVVKKPATTP